MKSKLSLFIGIILLITGIVLSVASRMPVMPLVLILAGVALKVYYIAGQLISGEYKAGWEFLLLVVGLGLFLSGVYLSNQVDYSYPDVMKISGLTLKGGFVVAFIVKSRRKKSEPEDAQLTSTTSEKPNK